MDVKKFMQDYATEINGQFSEYDQDRSVVIVPLPGGRFQSIRGGKVENKKYGKSVIQLLSRVCRTTEKIDYAAVLEHKPEMIHSRFTVVGDFLMLETIAYIENITPARLKEMIMETAFLADLWELRITGKDVN